MWQDVTRCDKMWQDVTRCDKPDLMEASCRQRRRAACSASLTRRVRVAFAFWSFRKGQTTGGDRWRMACKSRLRPGCRKASHRWCPTGCAWRSLPVLKWHFSSFLGNSENLRKHCVTVAVTEILLQSFGDLRHANLILLQGQALDEDLYATPKPVGCSSGKKTVKKKTTKKERRTYRKKWRHALVCGMKLYKWFLFVKVYWVYWNWNCWTACCPPSSNQIRGWFHSAKAQDLPGKESHRRIKWIFQNSVDHLMAGRALFVLLIQSAGTSMIRPQHATATVESIPAFWTSLCRAVWIAKQNSKSHRRGGAQIKPKASEFPRRESSCHVRPHAAALNRHPMPYNKY